MQDFSQLGINTELTGKLQGLGLVNPTPIQEKAIPELLKGRDIIAQAQTGTGKTLAFLLPMLEKIDQENKNIQGLIVTPTRELALQITTEINKIKNEQTRVLAVYGGQDVEKQLHKLKNGIHIVVGTPGRLLDHLRRETINLSETGMVVLDEADQMLHIGFQKDVEDILQRTSKERQTMLFSATISDQVQALSKKYLNQPANVKVKDKQITVKDIKQIVYEVTDREKQETICTLLDQQRPFLAVIFCRTKRRANALNEALVSRGYNSEELHGDLSQAKREKVMERFRKVQLQFLVATDVAARGLDVEGVTHVFNYDIPHDVESYIHRIGRTGRAGGAGVAITLAAPRDKELLHMIEKGIGMTLVKKQLEGTSFNVVAGRTGERPERSGRKRVSSGSRRSEGGSSGRSGSRERRPTDRKNGEKDSQARGNRDGATRSERNRRIGDGRTEDRNSRQTERGQREFGKRSIGRDRSAGEKRSSGMEHTPRPQGTTQETRTSNRSGEKRSVNGAQNGAERRISGKDRVSGDRRPSLIDRGSKSRSTGSSSSSRKRTNRREK